MRSLYLTTARFCVTAWVGAAVLFVITSVLEVTTTSQPSITSEVIDALVTIRFPAFYVMGFLLVATGILCCGLYLKHPAGRSKRMGVCLILLGVALIAMIADYVFIYRTLVEMITPPGGAKPANFRDYHNASMYINAFDIGLCLIAALLLCLPKRLEKN